MYILFAFIATLINLLFQFISISVYSGVYNLYVAMFFGTLAGLITKYMLDKKYIFKFKPKNKKKDFKTFIMYSLTGGITTFIFWGTEISFDVFWGSKVAKYIGAIIGLSIGYSIKYYLDKKYVFKPQVTS